MACQANIVDEEENVNNFQPITCAVNMLHQCKCGKSEFFQDVYVESCPVNDNEEDFYDCLPCPDACMKFSYCETCAMNKCLTCPTGRSGPSCELTGHIFQSPLLFTLKSDKMQNNSYNSTIGTTGRRNESENLNDDTFYNLLEEKLKSFTDETISLKISNESLLEVIPANSISISNISKTITSSDLFSNKNLVIEKERDSLESQKQFNGTLAQETIKIIELKQAKPAHQDVLRYNTYVNENENINIMNDTKNSNSLTTDGNEVEDVMTETEDSHNLEAIEKDTTVVGGKETEDFKTANVCKEEICDVGNKTEDSHKVTEDKKTMNDMEEMVGSKTTIVFEQETCGMNDTEDPHNLTVDLKETMSNANEIEDSQTAIVCEEETCDIMNNPEVSHNVTVDEKETVMGVNEMEDSQTSVECEEETFDVMKKTEDSHEGIVGEENGGKVRNKIENLRSVKVGETVIKDTGSDMEDVPFKSAFLRSLQPSSNRYRELKSYPTRKRKNGGTNFAYGQENFRNNSQGKAIKEITKEDWLPSSLINILSNMSVLNDRDGDIASEDNFKSDSPKNFEIFPADFSWPNELHRIILPNALNETKRIKFNKLQELQNPKDFLNTTSSNASVSKNSISLIKFSKILFGNSAEDEVSSKVNTFNRRNGILGESKPTYQRFHNAKGFSDYDQLFGPTFYPNYFPLHFSYCIAFPFDPICLADIYPGFYFHDYPYYPEHVRYQNDRDNLNFISLGDFKKMKFHADSKNLHHNLPTYSDTTYNDYLLNKQQKSPEFKFSSQKQNEIPEPSFNFGRELPDIHLENVSMHDSFPRYSEILQKSIEKPELISDSFDVYSFEGDIMQEPGKPRLEYNIFSPKPKQSLPEQTVSNQEEQNLHYGFSNHSKASLSMDELEKLSDTIKFHYFEVERGLGHDHSTSNSRSQKNQGLLGHIFSKYKNLNSSFEDSNLNETSPNPAYMISPNATENHKEYSSNSRVEKGQNLKRVKISSDGIGSNTYYRKYGTSHFHFRNPNISVNNTKNRLKFTVSKKIPLNKFRENQERYSTRRDAIPERFHIGLSNIKLSRSPLPKMIVAAMISNKNESSKKEITDAVHINNENSKNQSRDVNMEESSKGDFSVTSKSGNNRIRRDLDDTWCPLMRKNINGELECRIWSYQKMCTLTCYEGYESKNTEFRCVRSRNEWVPAMNPCTGKEDTTLKAPSKNTILPSVEKPVATVLEFVRIDTNSSEPVKAVSYQLVRNKLNTTSKEVVSIQGEGKVDGADMEERIEYYQDYLDAFLDNEST